MFDVKAVWTGHKKALEEIILSCFEILGWNWIYKVQTYFAIVPFTPATKSSHKLLLSD